MIAHALLLVSFATTSVMSAADLATEPSASESQMPKENFSLEVATIAGEVNTKLRTRGHHIVSVGTLNEAIVHPR